MIEQTARSGPSKRADDAAFDYETELAGARLPAGDQRMQLLAIDRDSEPAAGFVARKSRACMLARAKEAAAAGSTARLGSQTTADHARVEETRGGWRCS